MTKKLGLAIAATVVLLAGCGGGGGRPSVDDISKSLTEGTEVGGENFSVPEEQADCMAKIFVDSDLSDDALQAIVDQDEDYKASKEDEDAADSIDKEAIADCVTPQ